MTNKDALKIAKGVLCMIYKENIDVITELVVEEADGKNEFLKKLITELRDVCNLALGELENENNK